MSAPMIQVEGLGKKYIISHQTRGSYTALRDVIAGNAKRLLQKKKDEIVSEDFWALKDVSFSVRTGEAIGIIGRNGAGKSTLLKLLSRITEPTTGRIELNGKVASLLEVGTGFHPELTGRENIFLNGAILGMSRTEIRQKFDEIVEFSGVERFLDTPVKRYSSGMFVRLAFAIAAHLEPEILVVDEVLAVGDAEFQQKCLGKMNEVTQAEGRTVLFVSHDLNAITTLCKTALLLSNGKIEKAGDAASVVSFYINEKAKKTTSWEAKKKYDHPFIEAVHTNLKGDQPNLVLSIDFWINSGAREHKPLFVAFDIANSLSVAIIQAIPINHPFIKYSATTQKYTCDISLVGLIPDTYYLSAWIGEHNTITSDWQKEIISFQVIESPIKGRTYEHLHMNGSLIAHSTLLPASNE